MDIVVNVVLEFDSMVQKLLKVRHELKKKKNLNAKWDEMAN